MQTKIELLEEMMRLSLTLAMLRDGEVLKKKLLNDVERMQSLLDIIEAAIDAVISYWREENNISPEEMDLRAERIYHQLRQGASHGQKH